MISDIEVQKVRGQRSEVRGLKGTRLSWAQKGAALRAMT